MSNAPLSLRRHQAIRALERAELAATRDARYLRQMAALSRGLRPGGGVGYGRAARLALGRAVACAAKRAELAATVSA